MHGTPFLADIAIPNLGECLVFAAPFVAVAVVWWLFDHVELIIHRLFPHQEWEKQLGWLNIRAERRVETTLRWIGYGIHALLAVALYGILWGAQAFPALDHWNESPFIDNLALRFPVLLACLGFWLVYFGCVLLPKLRHQYEKEELEKFRVEMEEEEIRKQSATVPRFNSPLVKPRTNLPLRSLRKPKM